MSGPIRIQRQRTKGWKMPENTVYVGRPTLWGNPWSHSDAVAFGVPVADRAAWFVHRYERELEGFSLEADWSEFVGTASYERVRAEITALGVRNMAEAVPHFLRGKNLACWCPLDQPCHADTLLRLANA